MALSILRPVLGGLSVTYYGVRGSTPCAGPQFARYGGQSSCVVLHAADQPPIIFDLGTGLRQYGLECMADGPFHGTALLSHLHWDHVQGLPFFVPLHVPGATLDVYGPHQTEGPLGDVFAQMMRPPFFPIRPTDLEGDVRFHGIVDDDFPIGLAKIRSRFVRHVGATLGRATKVHRGRPGAPSDEQPARVAGVGAHQRSFSQLCIAATSDVPRRSGQARGAMPSFQEPTITPRRE